MRPRPIAHLASARRLARAFCSRNQNIPVDRRSQETFNRHMAGIVSYGSYIPYRRLKRAAIAEVLGVPAAKGERSVASFDEDSVSMAVEATRDALRSVGTEKVRTLFFATTTPPYGEKLHAAIIGAATLLPVEIRAADLTGSVRAGISS